jgi:hypothetical protein
VVFANPSWQKGRILFTQIHRNAKTTSRIGGYTQSQTPILPPKCGKTAGGGAFSICGASIGLTSIGTAAVIL